MTVTFWGVRGSIPVPAPAHHRYGGNTACLSIETDDNVLILDAGTGIRPLGTTLADSDKDLFVLLTHLHADHVQGFPFFDPLYRPGRTVHVLDYENAQGSWSLIDLFDGFHFPLRPTEMPADVQRVRSDGLDFLRRHGLEVSRIPVNHPGGAYGYRVRHAGRSIVYVPDNELGGPATDTFSALVAFCRDVDVLVHDAQYLAEELPEKRGWGHSSVEDVCQLALAAGAKHLVLFHHDPARSDEALDGAQERARRLLAPHGIACTAAYEGLVL